MSAPVVTYVDSFADLETARGWLAANPGRLALDTETTGLDVFEDDFEIGVVAFGHKNGNALVLNGGDRTLVRAVAVEAFKGRKVWAHNANFDAWAIRRVFDLKLTSLRCTLVAARAAWPGRIEGYALKNLRPTTQTAQDALRTHWVAVSGNRMFTKHWLTEAVRNLPSSDALLVTYCAEDTVETARLAAELSAIDDVGTRTGMLAEVRGDQLWRWAGYDGHRIDEERAVRVHEERKALSLIEIEHFGFNPATHSNARKAWVEVHKIVLPLNRKTGKPSMDKEARKSINPPQASRTEWNRLAAACDESFLMTKLGEMLRNTRDGVVHPKIKVNQAVTGRMSITEPALQNLAGGLGDDNTSLRGLLISRRGKVLVGCDLSHVEPSVMAALSGDPLLIKHCAPGMDVYVEAAAAVFGETARETTDAGILTEYAAKQRKVMKVVVLALMYGMGNTSLSASLGVSPNEAKRVRAKVLSIYPLVGRWIGRMKRETKLGIVPRTVTDRPLPCLRNTPYITTNYVIQGSAKDVFAAMTAKVHTALPVGATLWLPVHDELVIECEEVDAETVKAVLATHMRTELDGVLIWGEPEILGTRWKKA